MMDAQKSIGSKADRERGDWSQQCQFSTFQQPLFVFKMYLFAVKH